MNQIKKLFLPSAKYKGIWPIKVYVLKLFFLLMFLFVAKDAWAKLFEHHGSWNPEVAIAWCAMAAYTTLSGFGVFHTLRWLPIMLFMLLYKGFWLAFVAYPLWRAGTLTGSEAEGWSQIFVLIIIPLVFMPWKYFFKTFVLGRDYTTVQNQRNN
ncbi:hypothetical protein [Portibacter marinus]|uniref:hypothetical protein n=1 Tax=Portibacter marinus TaxID=2898660 RepID=UPI001F2CB3AD|nr:hypothetical protein [Portibacter marinus]